MAKTLWSFGHSECDRIKSRQLLNETVLSWKPIKILSCLPLKKRWENMDVYQCTLLFFPLQVKTSLVMLSAMVLYEIYGCMANSTGPDQTAPLSSLIRICTMFLDIFFAYF